MLSHMPLCFCPSLTSALPCLHVSSPRYAVTFSLGTVFPLLVAIYHPSGLLFHFISWVPNQTRIHHLLACLVGILSLPLYLVARSEVSPLQKRKGYKSGQIVVNPQCLLRMSAELVFHRSNGTGDILLQLLMVGSLGEGGSRDSGIGDHCLVISKHVALGVDGYTKIHECQVDVNDLVDSSPCSHQF